MDTDHATGCWRWLPRRSSRSGSSGPATNPTRHRPIEPMTISLFGLRAPLSALANRSVRLRHYMPANPATKGATDPKVPKMSGPDDDAGAAAVAAGAAAVPAGAAGAGGIPTDAPGLPAADPPPPPPPPAPPPWSTKTERIVRGEGSPPCCAQIMAKFNALDITPPGGCSSARTR